MKLAPIPGLDLVIDGDLRTVKKLGDDRESTLVLVRGGAGCGKTIFASHLALYEAAKRDGDVVYCCLELLPTELAAQLGGIWFKADGVEPGAKVEVVVGGAAPATSDHPRVLASIIEPALATELGRMLAAARARGFAPRVMVVDSLAEGYKLGPAVNRELADGIAKFAAEEGLIVILVEETTSASADSLWPFVADVVFELAHRGEAGTAAAESRSLLVTKSRFGRTVVGPHELELSTFGGVVINPSSVSYRWESLGNHRWRGARWRADVAFPLEREVVLVQADEPRLTKATVRGLYQQGSWLMLELERADSRTAATVLGWCRAMLTPATSTIALGDLALWRDAPEVGHLLPAIVELARGYGCALLLYDSTKDSTARHFVNTIVRPTGGKAVSVFSDLRSETTL